jgi:hypothetical protein
MNNGSMTVDKTSAAYQKNLIRTARYNLLVVMVFTVLNLVMLLVGNGRYFLFSSTICYYLPFFGYIFDLYTVSTYTLTGLVLGLVPLAGYLLFWLLSLKNDRWLIPATALFALDTLALAVVIFLNGSIIGMILPIIVYAWVMITLVRAVLAGARLRKLPAQPEAVFPEEPTEEENVPAEENAEAEFAAAEQE